MRLLPDEAHCWYVDLAVTEGAVAGFRATLTEGERLRSERFRFDRDRRRFVVAHAALRGVLAGYLGADPSRLGFETDASGKPALPPGQAGDLRFNLSHSDDLAAIAVAHAEVGVDIERLRDLPDRAEIARWELRDAFAERRNGRAGRVPVRAFFRSWTAREAFAKARGVGLGTEPATPPAGSAPAISDGHGGAPVFVSEEPWTLHALHPPPGHVGALVVRGAGWRVVERHWSSAGLASIAERSGPPRFRW